MDVEHFQLRDLPFGLSPDPRYLYLTRQHARAKAYMASTVWLEDGFVVIMGEIGSGKTTLIETFLQDVGPQFRVVQLTQTQLNSTEFLRAVLAQLGFTPFRMKKAELHARLTGFLVAEHTAGRKLLLVVDEAQNLTPKVLEEIRLLSGLETTRSKVLHILLAGQPELSAQLDSPGLAQLAQRVRLRFHLTALDESELRGYVQHRLDVAGAEGRPLFDAGCFGLPYRYTGGVPRLINTLCDTALMAARMDDHARVGPADLSAAIVELRWPEFRARPLSGARPGC